MPPARPARLIDEAWGAHLPFHDDLPTWGMNVDADVCVTSVHKAGSGFEQSSVFHLKGDLVDPALLKQREDLLSTTSTSSLIYAVIDGWRRQMVEQGEQLLGGALARAERIRKGIDGLAGLSLMGREVIRPGGAFDLDPLVLTIDVRGLGISGFQAGEWLRANCHVDIGSADACRISARLSYADDDENERRLLESLGSLVEAAGSIERPPGVSFPSEKGLELESVMFPRDAFFGRVEQVPVAEAAGRISAETVSPYPPGVPVGTPGSGSARRRWTT